MHSVKEASYSYRIHKRKKIKDKDFKEVRQVVTVNHVYSTYIDQIVLKVSDQNN